VLEAGAIDVLIRFSRLASDAKMGEILPLLAEAAIGQVKADGALVVEISPKGRLQATVTRGVPESALSGWQGDADCIGEELGGQLLAALGDAGKAFTLARTLPLVSTGGLFGALVLLFEAGHETGARGLQLAHAFVDLAAIAMGRANEVAKLEKVNAELRASREVLARSEKLRSLGQMAAGLTHDLKNILNPLSLHAQLIERAVARSDMAQVTRTVEEMKLVIKRGVETVERLRAFSRQSPEARAMKVDLDELAREAIAIARPRMASRKGALCRIVEDLSGVPPVMARGDEVVAAVVNLVANAIDAMPDGGTVTVSTRLDDGPRGGVVLTVSDTGPGMTPEVQARVFEPFFTTKGAEGTGLGLAMVFATMQRYGGTVGLDTAPEKGAAFTLWFPTRQERSG
jgi:signal transduction histidine kinase